MKPWSDADVAAVRARYADESTAKLAADIGRTRSAVSQLALRLGIRKSAAYLASDAAGRANVQSEKARAMRFTKAHTPWNKGKAHPSTGRAVETQFKPGALPLTHKPIGYERFDRDGVIQRKVADTRSKSDWAPVHQLAWIEANGPIPEGQIVIFKAGAPRSPSSAIVAENLLCMSRAELMRHNSYHKYPKEVARLIQLRGALNRQINKRARANEEQDGRSA